MRTRHLHPTTLILASVLLASGEAVSAQQPASGQAARALDQATDAFGVRSGVEQIGLYSESQVRGLSLQEAGNYRLEGAYFVRAGNLVDPILSRVSTRVGINALGLDFPAPSGVVQYQLRSPFGAPSLTADVTLREYGGLLIETVAAAPIVPELAVLTGGQISLARSSAGLKNHAFRAGALAEWRPSDRTRVLGFTSLNRFDLEGSYGVTVTGTALPPRMAHPKRYVPRWSDHDGWDLNFGAIGTHAIQPGLDLTGSAILSRLELPESEFTNLALNAEGRGTATIISNRTRTTTSIAAAAGASWRISDAHRLFGEVRLRRTQSRFHPGVSVRVPDVKLSAGLPDTNAPALSRLPATVDDAEQIVAGIGYEGVFGTLRLKGGLQRAAHRRRYRPPGQSEEVRSSSPWLYDLSLTAALGGGFTGWASLTRGLEDAGIAPAHAVNRNEVLPAVLADQKEIGMRWRSEGGLSIVGAAFSIRKPAAVLDLSGRFGLSGSLEHRGLELSVSGPIAPGLRLLAGGSLLDARRDGELVQAGLLSAEPPGISRSQGLAGLSWSVPGVQGLSLDGQLTYGSSRRVRSDRDLRTPAYSIFDVGALYAFTLGEKAMSLRFRVTNLFDSDTWVAGRSELLDRWNRRGVRLTLSARL